MGKPLLILVALCALLTACAAPTPTPPATLYVEATDLTAPLLSDLAAAYAEVNPKVTLIPSEVPLSSLSADLAAGRADLGLAVNRDPDQFAAPLGYVSLIVIVYPSNPVVSLSAAQVGAIYTGQINDWGQVGAGSGEIQVVGREDRSDAESIFEARALSDARAAVTGNALVAPTWDAMREAVSQNPNAIGFLPLPELDTSVKRVSVDADWRVLIVAVGMKEPTGAARDFLAWVQSEAGQRIVARRYEPVK